MSLYMQVACDGHPEIGPDGLDIRKRVLSHSSLIGHGIRVKHKLGC